jgi:hypothetical protein
VLFNSKCQFDRTILEKIKQGIPRPLRMRKQIDCFSQHRLANRQWRFKFLDPIGGPEMISLRKIESGDEGPGISDASRSASL